MGGPEKRQQAFWPQKINSCPKEENREEPSGQVMRKMVTGERHFGITVERKVKR